MKQLTNWYEDEKDLNFAIPLLKKGKKEKGDIEWEIRDNSNSKKRKPEDPIKYAIFREKWEEITDK